MVGEHDGGIQTFDIGFDHALKNAVGHKFGVTTTEVFGFAWSWNGQAPSQIVPHHEGIDFFTSATKGSRLETVGQDLCLIKLGGHDELAQVAHITHVIEGVGQ